MLSPTTLTLWILTLLIQNASFTLVSRARNSSSIKYHAGAAIASNGIWFIGQFFVVNFLSSVKNGFTLTALGIIYVTLTTVSSVLMHYVLMKKVEPKIKGGETNA